MESDFLLALIFNTHKKILLSTSLLPLQFAKCHCRDLLLQRLFWLSYWLSYGIFNFSHVIFNRCCISSAIISNPATVYYATYKHWPCQQADIYLYSLLCNLKTLISPVGTSFLGEVFRGFSSPVRQISGSFRPPRSPSIIWPSLSSSIIIHYGRQWPKILTCPKTSKYIQKHWPRLGLFPSLRI